MKRTYSGRGAWGRGASKGLWRRERAVTAHREGSESCERESRRREVRVRERLRREPCVCERVTLATAES